MALVPINERHPYKGFTVRVIVAEVAHVADEHLLLVDAPDADRSVAIFERCPPPCGAYHPAVPTKGCTRYTPFLGAAP